MTLIDGGVLTTQTLSLMVPRCNDLNVTSHTSKIFLLAVIAISVVACQRRTDEAASMRPPGFTPFDENIGRQRALDELSKETYESIGKPYGCKEDCRDQSLGFETAKARFTIDGSCDWPENPAPKDEGAFMAGCNAYVEAVNARLEKLRREHLEGKAP